MRRQRKFMNQINVVPYIDVMLVLLIIFMVTAQVAPGQIDLPQVGQSLKPPVSPLEVTIKENKTLLLRDTSRGASQQRVSREELIDAIRGKQANNPDQPVVIAADKNVRYEEVLNVMDILQQNQIKKIGLLAKSKAS